MVVRRMKNNELMHRGIKGQRKGVRRYQYANKTYTPAGNARYRPRKGTATKAAALAVTAASGLAWANAFNSATGLSAIMSTSLSSVLQSTVLLGAEIVAGFASIPVAAYALTIPMALMMAPITIQNGKAYIERRKLEKEYKHYRIGE